MYMCLQVYIRVVLAGVEEFNNVGLFCGAYPCALPPHSEQYPAQSHDMHCPCR